MNIFEFRNRVIQDYAEYVRSFIQIRDQRIRKHVQDNFEQGMLWPHPLIQLNPSFEPGARIDELVQSGVLHPECARIFQIKSQDGTPGHPLRLHRHQTEAIHTASQGVHYVLTTGTGSGKSLAYIVPIVDSVLRRGSSKGIHAIIVYPMNALANSQYQELGKFLRRGYPEGQEPVTFARYTGQEGEEERARILAQPPDILLTNYVMLELILTRPAERRLVEYAQGLRFLVLDEMHTYRGRQGADVALLTRRVREALHARHLQCVGTSATLADAGTLEEQQNRIAEVASTLFGAPVQPEHVISETLQRSTRKYDFTDPAVCAALRARINGSSNAPPESYEDFTADPLACWVEDTFGIRTEQGRLVRAHPCSLHGPEGAAEQLATLTSKPVEQCAEAIQQTLLAGHRIRHSETGFPLFAFRLHQFLSRGDTVYASLESASERHITVQRQQFVPGDRNRVLLPLVFCRECGQEYYCVRRYNDRKTQTVRYFPRDLSDTLEDDQGQPGFLYLSEDIASSDKTQVEQLRTEWLQALAPGLPPSEASSYHREKPPRLVQVHADGSEQDNGTCAYYFRAPFNFCLRCGVSYTGRQRDDFAKLASLSSEGRSTATTILVLSAVQQLRAQTTLHPAARKILSFTDDRQDASLQAGHFNDFVEVSLLRAALYAAVAQAGEEGLRHEEIAHQVCNALALPHHAYAANPEERFGAIHETQRALWDVLGYRIYRDLRRGWRITAPNLEQCGLLQIEYAWLAEACADPALWASCHPVLADAPTQTRTRIARTLLDYLRRELAIKVDYLHPDYQDQIRRRSERLRPPWALDPNELVDTSSIAYPCARPDHAPQGYVYLSERGGFGQYLNRELSSTSKLSGDEIQLIIRQLLTTLTQAGLVEPVAEPDRFIRVPGYQLVATAMRWKPGEGAAAFHDPIRVPSQPEAGIRPNPYFVTYYRNIALGLRNLEAREHTAQVTAAERISRESRFREGSLAVLFCSPTMELGIDISDLNVVHMRNVPPTPANYAQRSGRAGRSGQPALVLTYCTTGSPHDQYFFRRPDQMVSGAVIPPRMDLANEDLVRAHVHAIWLAEAQLDLGSALINVLDMNGDPPSLDLLDHVRSVLEDSDIRNRALQTARNVLQALRSELQRSAWWSEQWLEGVLQQLPQNFNAACDRWRGLYRAALQQQKDQNAIVLDISRPKRDRDIAERLRYEAEQQLQLLTDAQDLRQSDFYSYRYFASEGFLPGYNFPRLPLFAYIPGRTPRSEQSSEEFLARPRFLAIAEFGPRAFIYHEGARYQVDKVILPARQHEDPFSGQAKLCPACGYLHPLHRNASYDLCQQCNAELDMPMTNLFRMQNVVTQRRERISCDEEERARFGYDIVTAVRFTDYGDGPICQRADVHTNGRPIARITYGHAATLWRINRGWSRRREQHIHGFVLDIERGRWARHEQEDAQEEDPHSARTRRIIPYVEDRRNCLLFQPELALTREEMASLQAALKNAIIACFQLEADELTVEPLPNRKDRRQILLYEAAEGGAGVLRQLIDNPRILPAVAREALQICHFDPDTGQDRRRAPHAREDCEAACYDCLLSYQNQSDHPLLDRQQICNYLLQLANAQIIPSPSSLPRAAHLAQLLESAESELEKRWLQWLHRRNYRLPTHAQQHIPECQTRPDFLYQESGHQAAIYIDGPPHDFPHRQQRDRMQTGCMEDIGYLVIRFHHETDWQTIVERYPSIFGRSE